MIRFFTVICLLLTCLSTFAVELLQPVKVTVTTDTATISWKTDVACGTRVSYGKTLDKLDQKVEGPVTDAHEVSLTGLSKGTTYYYTVGSARQKLGNGNFTTGSAETAASAPATPAPPTAAAPAAPKSLLDRVRDALAPATPASAAKLKVPVTAVPTAQAPPTNRTWGYMASLQDHYDRHGADFQSKSPDDYAAQAWHFLQRAKAGELIMKWDDTDRSLRVFDPKTRAFAAYNRDGTTKTYFRPNSSSYWGRQPGSTIQPAQLPFK